MRHLYKTSAIIAGLILIKLLERIFDTISGAPTPFHTFFASLQVMLLQKSTVIVLATLLISELFIVLLLHHPAYIPKRILPLFRGYYDIFERDIIQFNPDCSRYDSGLFYTLIPGQKFAFNNMEFRTDYRTNSKGLRDDELSLKKPEIIVLGDSYAMGWGVQQDETFAQQLEKITGKNVLNAAMSSYGTARELKSFYTLDTSRLQYLIIQYCRNDVEENKQFFKDKNKLLISAAGVYDKAVRFEYWSKHYFPGKHFSTLGKWYIKIKLSEFWKKTFPHSSTFSTDSTEMKLQEGAQSFIDILYNSSLNFDKLKVFVIDMNNLESMNDKFVEKADSIRYQVKYKGRFKSNLVFIRISSMLKKEDYYILDPHLRPSGHKKIAALIGRYIFYP
jgi:hypothetical protein